MIQSRRTHWRMGPRLKSFLDNSGSSREHLCSISPRDLGFQRTAIWYGCVGIRDLWESKQFQPTNCFPVSRKDLWEGAPKNLSFVTDVWARGRRETFKEVLKKTMSRGRGRGPRPGSPEEEWQWREGNWNQFQGPPPHNYFQGPPHLSGTILIIPLRITQAFTKNRSQAKVTSSTEDQEAREDFMERERRNIIRDRSEDTVVQYQSNMGRDQEHKCLRDSRNSRTKLKDNNKLLYRRRKWRRR